MEKGKNRYLSSKLLLFGEYSIIKGSKALAMPFKKFKGKWNYSESENNDIFNSIAIYLKSINWGAYETKFDGTRFNADIKKGLIFSSDIPIGYGVGSSGALTAAIYNTYFEKKKRSTKSLRNILAKIESFFHGSSSGIDPLVSYLNQIVIISDKNKVAKVKQNISEFKNYNFFLIDTQISRETKKYVDIFQEKCKNIDFVENCLNPLVDLNGKIITSFLDNKENVTFKLFNEISNFQNLYFDKMIIPSLKQFWKNSLKTSHTKIKLCGAGGGGFYLLMSNKELSELKELIDFNLIPINLKKIIKT